MEPKMRFYLAENERCNLEVKIPPNAPHTVKLNLSEDLTFSKGNATRFEKFKKAFDRKVKDVEGTMTVEFKPEKNDPTQEASDPTSKLWSATVKSDVLKVVHEVLHCENPNVAVQFEMKLNFQVFNPVTGEFRYDEDYSLVKIDGFSPRQGKNGVLQHDCYRSEMLSFDPPPEDTRLKLESFSIKVDGSDFMCLEDFPGSATNRKIFTEKELCDFEIVSEDGTVIPCHKIFLWAKSPVFSKMLQEKKFKEAQENKMTIDDMSTRAINAFLEYLYCDDVHQAVAYCDVAFELLKASDKYDIPLLWKIITQILDQKSADWYDLDGTLKLTAFLINCQRQGSGTLARKAIRVLASKYKELADSTLYHELFPTPMQKGFVKVCLEAVMDGNFGMSWW